MLWDVKTIPAPYDEQILAIRYAFDFEELSLRMRQMHWEWMAGPDGVFEYLRLPTVGELRRVAQQLLEKAAQLDPGEFIAKGGFYASKGLDGWLTLEFVVEMQNGEDAIEKYREEITRGPHVESD